MVTITGVKFRNGGKVYYFDPSGAQCAKGTDVIVETANGQEFGTVVIPTCEVEDSEVVQPLRPVVRVADDRDREQVRRNDERRAGAIASAKEKVAARGLEMKIVGCEFAFEGNKVTFYFTADGRVDFRELIKDLSALFRMRIELRQIGIRDEIKLMGGLAPCGRECCCASCMTDFSKVSIKMAKNQGLSLNPGKISGLCGRLMCCLAYENDYYAEACKNVPKVGSEADTPEGRGTVINVNMLKMQVKVKLEHNDTVTYRDFDVSDIKFRKGCKDRQEDASDAEEQAAPQAAEEGEKPERQEKAERRDGNERHAQTDGEEGAGKERSEGDNRGRRDRHRGRRQPREGQAERTDGRDRPAKGDRPAGQKRQKGAEGGERRERPEGENNRPRRDRRNFRGRPNRAERHGSAEGAKNPDGQTE